LETLRHTTLMIWW